jgi:hypothetical protein
MTAIDFVQPAFTRGHRAPTASAVRVNGGAVVCGACGCRLTTRDSADDAGFSGARSWFHYVGGAGRDARGCAVSCADTAHGLA